MGPGREGGAGPGVLSRLSAAALRARKCQLRLEAALVPLEREAPRGTAVSRPCMAVSRPLSGLSPSLRGLALWDDAGFQTEASNAEPSLEFVLVS